jgi:3-oxoacyl-[acyl-carrier protein] reductase
MSLAGKCALVTGGSGAIGSAICRRLAAAGAAVVVQANRNLAAAEETVRAIAAADGQAQAISFDICDGAAARAAVERLTAKQTVQIVVHAAGLHDDAPLAGMSAAQWSRVIDVSLNGFFNVTQPALLPMIRTRWGRVIAVSSVSALLGNRGQANYAAAKAGLHGAVRTLALEYASRGVTANVIAPGIIATPESATVFPQDRIESLVPMKRAGTPDEVAALAGFLASDEAAYITGQVIAVGGGLG